MCARSDRYGNFKRAIAITAHTGVESDAGIVENGYLLTIDTQFELLARNEISHAEILHVKGIFSVCRKIMPHSHPSTSAKRHAFELRVLRSITCGNVGSFTRRTPVANGQTRNPGRR